MAGETSLTLAFQNFAVHTLQEIRPVREGKGIGLQRETWEFRDQEEEETT